MNATGNSWACRLAVALLTVASLASGQTKPAAPVETPTGSAPQTKPSAQAAAEACTVHPDSASVSAQDKPAKTSGAADAASATSSQGTTVQVTVTPSSAAPSQAATPASGKKPAGSTQNSAPAYSLLVELEPGMTNATEVAPKLKDAGTDVLSATAVGPSSIAVELKLLPKNQKATTKQALEAFARPFAHPNPYVFPIVLAPGTRSSC